MALTDAVLPLVSVVVVNYRGAEHTITCLRALAAELDYPAERLELICVDNASGDGSAERIRAALGERATLIESPRNTGFAGGCNLGARHARGSVLAFLNSDARPHPRWVSAAVEVLASQPGIGAVASKVLDWDGERVDFTDAGLTWFGMGYSHGGGQPDAPERDTARDVLFGTGAAMFVRAGLFAELEGFDERFFMFYEDVDLGWRLNNRGWRFRFEPGSVAYHRHHAAVSDVDGKDSARELYLLERNALCALYKNLEDETLARVLPAALALAVRRATARGDLDATQLEMNRAGEEAPLLSVPRPTMAGVFAIDQFVELLPHLRESRELEQRERTRTDADLVTLMRKALEPAYPLPRYLAAHDILTEVFGIGEVFGRPRRIAVLTGDAVAERMAGPAIRAWHTAEVLAVEHTVRLVSVNPNNAPPDASFEVHACTPKELHAHVDWADVVVLQGHTLQMVPELARMDSRTILVCDVYDPMHLELLEQSKQAPEAQRGADVAGVTEVLNTQLRRGDFFLCASERQRHFWLGHLAALGRIGPGIYDTDPTMRSLIAEVPFGLPAAQPHRNGPGIRDAFPAIGERDKVILWAGGVYSWFDPLTLIRAVDRLRAEHPDVRLVFLGMRHPNPDVPDMEIAVRTRQLAGSLGLTGKHVFFNEGWVPYTERQNWLLDADAGVTTHFQHVETEFAFRTRVLDYLWSGLPIVTTDGDSFADLVRAERLGSVVPAEDAEALAAALASVLYDESFAQDCVHNIAAVRERFTWEHALAPLLAFCRNPRPAADRLAGAAPLTEPAPLTLAQGVLRDIGLVREYLAAGGVRELGKRAGGRVRKLASNVRSRRGS
ncbi:glycosyltransferase [Sciscionella sediminilitoris]|uniref:glycosyltransferase n=1 Tax=Sciscionella sediminilitoris TaxID=1445613 RepID=UPI0004DF5E14